MVSSGRSNEMMWMILFWIIAMLLGVGAIVWGAETFAKHLAAAATKLGVSSFALALLLAGAEPEELATAVMASVRKLPAIALGDVIGANITICLVALGVGALVAPLPFGRKVLRYSILGLPLGAIGAWFAWNGHVSRVHGALLVLLYLAYVAVVCSLKANLPRWVKRRNSKRPVCITLLFARGTPAGKSFLSSQVLQQWPWARWCWLKRSVASRQLKRVRQYSDSRWLGSPQGLNLLSWHGPPRDMGLQKLP